MSVGGGVSRTILSATTPTSHAEGNKRDATVTEHFSQGTSPDGPQD